VGESIGGKWMGGGSEDRGEGGKFTTGRENLGSG